MSGRLLGISPHTASMTHALSTPVCARVHVQVRTLSPTSMRGLQNTPLSLSCLSFCLARSQQERGREREGKQRGRGGAARRHGNDAVAKK